MSNLYNPAARRRGEATPPKNSFQRELEAKMKDRHSRGLSAGISEEELSSEDELMSQFNMTNKSRTSPSPGEQRKSPWAPPGSRKSPRADDRKSPHNRKSPYLDDLSRKSANINDEESTRVRWKSPREPFHTNQTKSPADQKRGSSLYYKKSVEFDEQPVGGGRKSPWEPPGSKNRRGSSPRDKLHERSPLEESNRRSPRDDRRDSAMDTIFGKRSDTQEDDNQMGLSKTMRKPWQSPGGGNRKAHGSLYEEDDDDDQYRGGRKTWQSPAGKHIDADKENMFRAKSPGSRKSSTRLDDLEDEDFDRPRPTPRSSKGNIMDHDEYDRARNKYSRDNSRERPGRGTPSLDKEKSRSRGNTPSAEVRGKSSRAGSRAGTPKNDEGRKTPTENKRKSLFDIMNEEDKKEERKFRDSDSDDSLKRKGRRKSDSGRKSPHTNRKSPYSDRGKSKDSDEEKDKRKGRKSPFGDRKTPTRNRERSHSRGRQDSDEEAARRKSPFGRDRKGRRTPYDDEDEADDKQNRRKSPFGIGRKRDESPDDSKRRSPYRRERDESPENRRGKSPLGRKRKESPERSKSKSPFRRKRDDSPENRRKSPFGRNRDQSPEDRNRKSPFGRKRDESPDDDKRRRKKSSDRDADKRGALRKQRHLRSDSSEDEQTSAFKPVPKLRGGKSYDDMEEYEREMRRREDEEEDGDRRSRSRSRSRNKHKEERESSVCREVDTDPGPMKRQHTKEGENIRKKEPKHQRKEKQLLDQVINSVGDAQPRHSMKYIDPDEEKDDKNEHRTSKRPVPTPRRSILAKLLRSNSVVDGSPHTRKVRPRPRYGKAGVTSTLKTRPTSARSDLTFDSTTNIRDLIYQEWYEERGKSARAAKREQQKREKEEEEKEKKNKEDRYVDAKASFNAWMENKKDFGKDKVRAKRKEEDKKRKEEEEKYEKKREAESIFRKWKEDKDAEIREHERKKKRKEEKELRHKQDDEADKRKDNEHAFRGWKEKKDRRLMKAKQKEEEEKREKERQEQREKRYREKDSMKSYEDWMSKKEKQDYKQSREEQRRKYEEERGLVSPRPPWSPAARTIPAGR